ncbi:MAG: Holliday junction branch migration protein RuvA [Bacteroidales bacterium]|nr:Holliday junction branch migration protein RuvA [Bacteroidales bacterium]
MYEYLSGKLAEITPSFAVIDCGGVGYMVEITVNTYTQIKDRDNVKLYVHYVVREDAHLLFGFYEIAEREMFRMLISISGVGVNTARVMLSTLTVDELKEAVATKNVKKVQSVKGIGAKGAQRIILEMQDKIGKVSDNAISSMFETNQNLEEALAALVMLGFQKAAADKVLQAVNKKQPGLSVEELIKEGLKAL